MSHIAEYQVVLPEGVQSRVEEGVLFIKGVLGELSLSLSSLVKLALDQGTVHLSADVSLKPARAMLGTFRALIMNMCTGVTKGFEKRLLLNGTGYRVQLDGARALNLSLGFSHPVVYALPEGIKAEVPSQSELIIRGIDKRLVGAVTAEIRAYRPLEPYKGKGFRYADEVVVLKEVKKK